VKDFTTIIINVTPSPWSRPGSSHEDLHMHANTHVHADVFFVDILGRNSVVGLKPQDRMLSYD
jgi:hypothetical protein